MKLCENKDFCNIEMPSQDNKMLEFNKSPNFVKACYLCRSGMFNRTD